MSFQERLVIAKIVQKRYDYGRNREDCKNNWEEQDNDYREVLHNTSDGQPYNAKEAQKRAKANLKQKNIAKQLARGETTRKKVYVCLEKIQI